MQMLLGMYPQLAQAGIVQPANVYNAVRKVLEIMGYKNAGEFISPPPPPPGPDMGLAAGAPGMAQSPGLPGSFPPSVGQPQGAVPAGANSDFWQGVLQGVKGNG